MAGGPNFLHKTVHLEKLCTKAYSSLVELVHDAERIEIEHHRYGKSVPKFANSVKTTEAKVNEPVPMDI